MKTRTKLKTALFFLAAATNMTYASESCVPPKKGQTPLDVLECLQKGLDTLAASNKKQQAIINTQQGQISELTAKTEKQQATINTQQGQIAELASIKTTEPIQVQHQTFKVGGDFEKFYPVVFSDDGWGEGALELEIFRPYVHTDSKWRGALLSKLAFHSSSWGNGAEFQYAEIHQSKNQFIASYQNHYHSPKLIIWLRGGGTSYHWRSNHPATLLDFEAKSKVLNPTNKKIKLLLEVKTEIAPSLNRWHVYPWND